jgi:hypothetical protein
LKIEINVKRGGKTFWIAVQCSSYIIIMIITGEFSSSLSGFLHCKIVSGLFLQFCVEGTRTTELLLVAMAAHE